jgi:hypothetical protein
MAKSGNGFFLRYVTFCRDIAALCRALYSFVPPRHLLSGCSAQDSYFFPVLALVADILLSIFDLKFGSTEIRQTRKR